MFIAKDGFLIILIFAITSAISISVKLKLLSLVLLILLGFTLYFFRDPKIPQPKDTEHTIYSPATGTILNVEQISFDEKDYTHVSIFLSVFDVHINRIPFSGKILSTRYFPGKFIAANKNGIEQKNERMEVLMDTKYGKMKFIQIAGMIARKIVCRLNSEQEVQVTEKYGMIKFGSRTDVIFPATAKCLIEKGDKVQGGISKIATFKSENLKTL